MMRPDLTFLAALVTAFVLGGCPARPSVSKSQVGPTGADPTTADPNSTDPTDGSCSHPSDCPRGQLCCETTPGEFCIDPPANQAFPCPFREVCAEDVPCRTPNTRCVSQRCEIVRPSAPLRCGEHTCTLPFAICLVSADPESAELRFRSRCAPDAGETEGSLALLCTAPTDCVEGEFCGLSASSSECTHGWDGNTEIICATPRDCPLAFVEHCESQTKQPSCEPVSPPPLLPGMRMCGCV